MHMSRAIGDRVHLVSVPAASDGAGPLDSEGLLTIIWRGKWLVAAGGLTALLIGALYVYILATPLYRATAVLRLLPEREQITDFPNAVGRFSGDKAELNSEVEVLRGRVLLAQVVERLDLTSDPEFNAQLQEGGAVGWLPFWGGRRARYADLSPSEKEQRGEQIAVSKLFDAVTVRNIPLSRVIQVSIDSESARKSALIANKIVEHYVHSQVQAKVDATRRAALWLTERATVLQAKLQAAEAAAAQFNAATELISVESLRGMERQLKELRSRIVKAQAAQAVLERQRVALASAATAAEKVNASEDAQLASLLDRLQDESDFARAFDKRFQVVFRQNYESLRRSEQLLTTLRASEVKLSAQVSRQTEDVITLQQLTLEAEAARVLYENFLSRLNEAAALQGHHRGISQILSEAVMPLNPSSPRKSLILAMAGVSGLIASIGFILCRELRRDGFCTARDLETVTGHRVLGQIPKIPMRAGKNVAQYIDGEPTSAAAEAVRDLRISVMRLNTESVLRTLVLTSAVEGEGATTIALALAQSLSCIGKSVLLVEGDTAYRSLSRHFAEPPDKGLAEVMEEEITFSEGIKNIDGRGLDVLLCGGSGSQTADMFTSNRFRMFIETARQTYDIVIINTPPVLAAPNARIITELADASLFVVRWKWTSRGRVEEAMRVLQSSGQRITGMVLTQNRVHGAAGRNCYL
ncbi:MAG: GNVR domain-containing protein [Roseovarius sp.]